MLRRIILFILCLFYFSNLFAAHQVVKLVVNYKTVNFAGKARKAIAINNQIPAPTLHFKQGDTVTIYVHNQLDKETAIHWHGLLVPWQMDGVLGISQKGIKPGNIFKYQFTLKQAGTYWYHAHAGLQEQQGLYGGFVIDPPTPPSYHYTKDYVVVLSDWSNTYPDQILANLKKDGHYYSPRFPLQPSLTKFIHDYRKSSVKERQQLVDDYAMMQQMRMSIYDINDVAYDAFLLNGHPPSKPWTALVKVGDVVRLRFIGAGGNSIFRVKMPDNHMQMVHVQGNDIKPYPVKDFSIAPGETYDVLVKINNDKPSILYAESTDTLGAAYGALLSSPHQYVDYTKVQAFPEPPPVTREMMFYATQNNEHTNKHHSMPMQHEMHMPTESSIQGDEILPPTKNYHTSYGTKYQAIKAAIKTNNPDTPVAGVINMELFGYMDHFIWFINGVPEHYAKPIVLQPGKRYRIIFTNTSMMHHPMHIHGHWFILRKGRGAYDPLLHTIDVPPGATVTADIDTDASGQWFFHCHFLYHMMAGMSRVFQYSSIIEITKDQAKPQHIIKLTNYQNRPIIRVDEAMPIDTKLIYHPIAHEHGFWFASHLHVGINPITQIQKLTFKGLYGPDYNKLELFINDAEMDKGKLENADIDIFYWRLLYQFWAIKGGVNYFYRPATAPYWQPGIGIEALMPYFIELDLRTYYYSGSAKFDIEFSRDTQITNNFLVKLGIRSIFASKTVNQAGIGGGLNQMRYIIQPYYQLMPGVNVFAEFEREKAYGSFAGILKNDGESTSENTLTFGLSVLF